MDSLDIVNDAIETLKANGAVASVKVVDYATNIPARRDMISAAFRVHLAKDPIATMKKFEKRYGDIIRTAHGAAYEIGYYRNACIAACHQEVDRILSEKFGWEKTTERSNDQ